MRVPFTDLRVSESVASEISQRWSWIVESGQYIGGPTVAAWEEAWAEYCGARFCVSCANGTDAIELAARAIFSKASRVSVPALTFIGTVEGLERATLSVEVVDIDEVSLLAEYVDVAVPLYRPVSVVGALVDGAQAHGLEHSGEAMTWSFYPTKNLGAWGDAGAVTTNDEGLAQEIRERANHGGTDGWNSRCDAVHAAVLLSKLPGLDEALTARATAGARYANLLAGEPRVRLLPGGAAWHLYVVRVAERDRVLEALQSAGVDARTHYPQTVQRWGGRDLPGECPIADQAVKEVLSLPLWPGISVDQQEYVCSTLVQALA